MTDPDRLVLPDAGSSWRDESVGDEAVGAERVRRAAYRAWVQEHHPDRGGDPTAFAQALQVWQQTLRHPAVVDSAHRDGAPPAEPVTFHRTPRSSPLAWWAARRAERARPARVR